MELPIEGEIYTVTEGSFMMIGQVIVPKDESDYTQTTYRGIANYLVHNGYVQFREWNENRGWCFWSRGRTYRLANYWERRWFRMCSKVQDYVDPPSKEWKVQDFIKFKN